MLRLETPEGRERILLHCCCAPCSGAVVECMVQNGLRPALFFSNSNIVPHEEYELRRGELVRYAGQFGLEVIDDEYDHEAWLRFVLGEGKERQDELAAAPERGPRCLQCFKFRLLRAAQYAAGHGFDVLATTLASSRWKSLDQVDEAGRWACGEISDRSTNSLPRPLGVQGDNNVPPKDRQVLWWNHNWRKGGLQPRRAEIIKEQNFYNQTWCGCEFSRRSRD